MYGHFNPFDLTDAWWQHLLMLIVSAVLGYIIGYRSGMNEVEALETELESIDSDLDDCQRNKKITTPPVAATPIDTVPAVTVAAPVLNAFVAPTTDTSTPDDLKVVEGIGPKIEQLLHNAGIKTFAQLADSNPTYIKEILDAAGRRYQIHDPSTWPQQSALARDGKWDELKTLQDALYKGRA